MSPNDDGAPRSTTLPVVHEFVDVHTRETDTAVVRVRKRTEAREATVDAPSTKQTIIIERVPMNQVIDSSHLPDVRQEGDTLIVPAIEEQVVVSTRLVLTEEVRITRRAIDTQTSRVVVLNRERIDVERERLADADPPGPPSTEREGQDE